MNSARLGTRGAGVIAARMKLARLFAATEEEARELALNLEESPVFKRLKLSGVVRLAEFPRARFAAKQFAGCGVKLSAGSGLGGLIDGNGEIVKLIQRVGRENFEKWFLRSEASEATAAEECDLTLVEARRLREFVDKVYIQAEFDSMGVEPQAPPEKFYSAVAGITIENGRPVLAFFNREVWKGKYSVDSQRFSEYLSSLSGPEAEKAQSLMRRLEFIEQRKTTLYRLLELLLKAQEAYLVSGDPEKRKPLTQRDLSREIGTDPSVLNRLVSNKSVQLPWGLEAPLVVLIPSAKDIAKELLYGVIETNQGRSDEKLRQLLEERHAIKLSRRSIAQYRKELEAQNNRAGA